MSLEAVDPKGSLEEGTAEIIEAGKMYIFHVYMHVS